MEVHRRAVFGGQKIGELISVLFGRNCIALGSEALDNKTRNYYSTGVLLLLFSDRPEFALGSDCYQN